MYHQRFKTGFGMPVLYTWPILKPLINLLNVSPEFKNRFWNAGFVHVAATVFSQDKAPRRLPAPCSPAALRTVPSPCTCTS